MSTNKLNIDHLSENECEKILGVLQRDFELRNKERTRLRPEDISAIITSKPPVPPRLEKDYGLLSQLSTQPYTLRESLHQNTSIPSTTHLPPAQNTQVDRLSNRNTISSTYTHGYAEGLDLSGTDTPRHKYRDRHSPNRSDFISNTSSSKSMSSQFCSRCGDTLSPNIKRKAQCIICIQWICKLCALWEPKHEGYMCETHTEEEGYAEYNRHSVDWMYDSQRRQFVRTYSGEIAATIRHRLADAGDSHQPTTISGDNHQPTTLLGEIPPLSLEAFELSMEGLLNKETTARRSKLSPPGLIDSVGVDSHSLSENGCTTDLTSTTRNTSHPSRTVLSANDFFQTGALPGENVIMPENLEALERPFGDDAIGSTSDVSCSGSLLEEDQPFYKLKEEETKRFLCELNESVKKVKQSLVSNSSESQTEELLAFYRSAISAMVINLEQSLHLAVDRQNSGGKVQLVRHSEVASIVCSIVEEFIGEALPTEVMESEGALNYGEAAEFILAQVLYADDSQLRSDDYSPESETEVKESTGSSTDTSYSDYGSYKFPSFDINSNSMDVDPDLLSLGQGANSIYTDMEDEVLSEESGPWDSESIISGTSSNWTFRGKAVTFDSLSLSGKSSLFNAHSASEESLSALLVPQTMTGGDDKTDLRIGDHLSEDGSEFTLTSSSEDSLLADALNLTPRADPEEDMIRTELRRISSSQTAGRDKPGYVSVSRSTSVSTTGTERSAEYSEIGEDSGSLRFTTKPRSRTVCSGDVAKFTCSVSGESPIDVYWFKEGVDDTDALETGDKYELTSENDRHMLEVFFTSAEDSGQYLCLAKNDFTSSHWLFGLTVEESTSYEQKAPLFLKELYDVEITEGDTVKFRCKVRAYPAPRVTWYKDGQRIDNSHYYKFEKFGNRDYMLTISGVTLDHDAEFTVLARNGAGEAKSTAQLLVEPFDREEKPLSSRRDKSKHNGSGDVSERSRDGVGRRPLSSLQSNSADIASIVNSTEPLTMEQTEERTPNALNKIKTSLAVASKVENSLASFPGDSGKTILNSDSSICDEELQIKTLNHKVRPNEVTEVSTHSDPKDITTNMAEASSPLRDKPYGVQTTLPPATTHSGEITSVKKVADLKPQRSLRSALRREQLNSSSTSQVEHSVKIKPSVLSETRVNGEQPQNVSEQIQPTEHRHSSSVQLLQVMPLNTGQPCVSNEPVDTVADLADSKSVVSISPNHLAPVKCSQTTIQADSGGVDIQPGFVRELQFQRLGDNITPIRPVRKQKKAAPPPPPPMKSSASIEITGSSQQGDIPSSRGEWSDFFPSIKQRRESLSSDTSSDLVRSQEQVLAASSNHIVGCQNGKGSVQQTSNNKVLATSSPSSETQESDKKKTVKKVVKRTVSVKRSIIPSTVGSFGEGPPNDGCDYIKVCGKWVKMKAKARVKTEPKISSMQSATVRSKSSQDKNKTVDDEEVIPVSRSEWGNNLPVGQQMRDFKRKQESKGDIITGRNWGPITKV